MRMFNLTVAAFTSALLLAAAYAPAAWPATANQALPMQADVMPVKSEAQALPNVRSWFEPSPADAQRGATTNCKAGRIYSQHDVVGDPQACLKGIVTFGGAVGF
ncbi:MAG: hypothetical protein ACREQN_03290 [Candidatus Binataceae bacterium]